MKKNTLLCLIGLIGILSACYYDKEEELYPPEVCDLSDSTFTNSVVPILQNHCYPCHSNANYAGISGISLEGHANVKVQVDNGQLLKAINHEAGAEPMPRNSSKLSDCKIQLITNWISAGAKND